jgi:hypothetical protein
MAQAFSHRPLLSEARVRTRAVIYGVCGGQSSIGTDFSPSSSAFPCQYRSIVVHHTHVSLN